MRDLCNARVLIGIFFAGAVYANGQWLNQRDKSIPRMPDGKPNLSAPAPRASNGKPDLSGVWQAQASQPGEVRRLVNPNVPIDPSLDLDNASKYFLNILADFKPAEEPIHPEAASLLRQRRQALSKDAPPTHCLPLGVPWSTSIVPFKLIQTPVEIVILAEDSDPPRQIYLDGRQLPTDPEPSWMGYSVGEWQGDTLVVNTIGFNDRSWLDASGHPHSESMHVVERFRRIDVGHVEMEISVDDPKMYARTFTVKIPARLMPDTDILESVCAENERDRSHLDSNSK